MSLLIFLNGVLIIKISVATLWEDQVMLKKYNKYESYKEWIFKK